MWIRTQNKERLADVNELRIESNGYYNYEKPEKNLNRGICSNDSFDDSFDDSFEYKKFEKGECAIMADGLVFGLYASKERALQVMDDISDFIEIEDASYYRIINNEINTSKILKHKVYEMPSK